MNRLLLFMAWLGVVLVIVASEIFLPDTPIGRIVQFAMAGLAFYPLAQATWLKGRASWRFWTGLATGVLVFAFADRLRGNATSDANDQIGMIIFGAISVALVANLIWRHRQAARTQHRV